MLILFFGLLLLLATLSGGTDGTEPSGTEVGDLSRYTAVLRTELEGLLSRMDGVGRCTVLVTFSDGGETVYAVDGDRSEGDGRFSEKQEHVLVSSRSDGLVISVRTPAVAGVAVICDGGDRASVKSDVTEVLSGILGLPSSRISVKKRSQSFSEKE